MGESRRERFTKIEKKSTQSSTQREEGLLNYSD